VAGPVGLGFRVPMLVVSPFSRGGFVCSDTFDHTSLLRFLETRFGVEVPNLSAWRRSVTGDLTTAFNFARPDASVPPLPQPSLLDTRVLLSSCATSAPVSLLTDALSSLQGLESTLVAPYPVPPPPQAQPGQEPGSPLRPSGPVACAT
jgi:phospholipase C